MGEHSFRCSEVVDWYNQRGECSENRIRKPRSDLASARLPYGHFQASTASFRLIAIACNLMALLPTKCS